MVKGAGVRNATSAADEDVWLAVETSTPIGSVAVWKNGLAFEQAFRIQGAHSELVLPAIDEALTIGAVAPEQVASFIVGVGPGSFTGVRIAVSLAKGWAMARGTTLYAYSSLLVVAGSSGLDGQVCALFDARRGEVYGACYELSYGNPPIELIAPGAWTVTGLLDELANQEIEPVFAGEGAQVYRESIISRLAGAKVLPEHLAIPRAGSLLWLREVAADQGRVERPEDLEPLYARDWKVPNQRARD